MQRLFAVLAVVTERYIRGAALRFSLFAFGKMMGKTIMTQMKFAAAQMDC